MTEYLTIVDEEGNVLGTNEYINITDEMVKTLTDTKITVARPLPFAADVANCADTIVLKEENEKLREALKYALDKAEACWVNHYSFNSEGIPLPLHITKARALLEG